MLRYALRHCIHTEYPYHTVFSCPHEPHYLLTRECSAEYYNAQGICCKIDEAIDFLVNENPTLFNQIKYVMEGDDDTFFRPDQVLRWLSLVEKSGIPLSRHKRCLMLLLQDRVYCVSIQDCRICIH
jgi:hypothetical protein